MIGVFNKKFKVRIQHFGEGKYTVQYAHYRLIPIWHSLMFWYGMMHPNRNACWSLDLFHRKEAEKLSESFRSIKDVNDYYKPIELERSNWLKEETEYWKREVPYSEKYFDN